MYISQALREAQGNLFLSHLGWPENQVDLPRLAHKNGAHEFMPACNAIRLYPIVDRAAWLEQLLPLGIRTIQLRIKDLTGNRLETEIKKAIRIANSFHAQLFINDYWELAIRHQAYGVHLGQEDLDDADIKNIRTANLRLGISTHSYYELARAHAYHPSYFAFGPIFPTTSKIMSFAAQGLDKLQRIRRTLKTPLVAIGGINQDRIDDIINVGVDGVAMMSAITKSSDPIFTTNTLLKKFNRR
jgi:hydroxymethylpyrimidine kinase/phosphomethylpyrimidine kinase/thiamine-phosphate diphosphorylase